MEKRIELYDPAEYVESRKAIPLKFVERDEFDKQNGELLAVVGERIRAATARVSQEGWNKVKGDRDAIKQYLTSIYASVWDEVITEFRGKADNDWKYRALYCGLAGIKDTEEEAYYYWLTHQAKYHNEAEYREVLRHEITSKLRSGKPLTRPENEWLAYILERIDVPHESKGAPKRKREVINRQYALAWFILNDKMESPVSTIKARLERATSTLCISYETVRNDYYSDEYKRTYDILSKLQQEEK